MKRRDLLKAGLLAACFPQHVFSSPTNPEHPFEKLVDVLQGRAYQANPNKYVLAVFMTGQRIYPSCGEVFLGLMQVMQNLQADDWIEPVIVMPKFENQRNPRDERNFDSALRYNGHIGLRILSGDLEEMMSISDRYSNDPERPIFGRDQSGKIIHHTLDTYFLSPDGEYLFNDLSYNVMGSVENRIKDVQNTCKRYSPSFCIAEQQHS